MKNSATKPITKIESERAEFYGTTLRLALPVMLQSLLSGSFSMLDTLMVSSLGDGELSAIAMASQWTSVEASLVGGIGAGLGIFAAQKYGIGDKKGIRASGGVAMLLMGICVFLMLLLAEVMPGKILGFYTASPQVAALGVRYLRIVALAYPLTALETCLCAMLRNTEQVLLPLTASLLSMVMNVVGNYVFIFGKLGLPPMGVEGAALATVLSALIAPVFLLVLSRKRKNILIAPLGEYAAIDGKQIGQFLSRAMPVIANLFLYTIGQTVVTAVFSKAGDRNAAVLSIVGSVINVISAGYAGISAGIHVVVGKQIGAGQVALSRRSAKRYIALSSAFGAVVGAGLIVLRMPIIGLFNGKGSLSEATITMTAALLLLRGLDRVPAYFHGSIMDGVFRAGGDTVASAVIDIVGVWCVSFPMALLTVRWLGLPFVTAYTVVSLAELLPKCLVTAVYFHTDRWMKPVTEAGRLAVAEYRGRGKKTEE